MIEIKAAEFAEALQRVFADHTHDTLGVDAPPPMPPPSPVVEEMMSGLCPGVGSDEERRRIVNRLPLPVWSDGKQVLASSLTR